MIKHDCKVRVRYCETDQMGYTHHSTYINYFEHGRSELLRYINHPYAEMEKYGVMSPIMSIQIRYVRPTKYDDEVTIHTEIRQLPDDFAVFHQEIYNEKGKLICGGAVKLTFVDGATRKRVKAPAQMLEAMALMNKE